MAASNEHSNSCAYCSSAEIAPGRFEFAFGNEPGLARLEHHREPARLRLRAPPQLEEGVAALRRADEHGPALPVGERRADDLRPHPRIHVGVFVEHHAVEIDAAHGVGIVGAVEPHLPAVDVVDAQLALVRAGADRASRRHRRAQIVPRHRLRLAQKRREVGEARPHFRDASRRGAGRECRPRSCRRGGGSRCRRSAASGGGRRRTAGGAGSRPGRGLSGSFHSNTTLPGASSAAALATDLPSMRSKISFIAARSPSSALAASLRAISRRVSALDPSPSSLSRRSSAASASHIGRAVLPPAGETSSMLMSPPLR